jgi:mannose-6-phosphate isomerase-like protein (cupin superfamily)
MKRVYENAKWTVGIKNWKQANDIAHINCVERHNQTDELFVLVAGTCTLIQATESGERLDIQAVKMEKGKVYNIPQGLWHNTVTREDTKLILIEDSSTGSENSDVRDLTPEEIGTVKNLAL